jgi:archaeal chaperonin
MNEDKQPVYVLPENVSRTIGKTAQRNNILAAKVVADIVKTTLGPKGMDKMLVDSSGNIIVTNDGVTILDEMEMDHPAAKMMVEIAKTQEREVGDGTTTAVLLAGKLLERAEHLLERRIHPTSIAKGYLIACEKSLSILSDLATNVKDDFSLLKQIAMTAMTGKGAEGNKEELSDLIVRAVMQVSVGKETDLDDIKIQKITGEGIKKSELVQGIVLDKEKSNMEMPSRINGARILLIDFAFELKSPETEARISVNTPEQLEQFISSEERYLKQITDRVIKSGANVLFCQKGIDDVAQYYLAKAGVMAVRRVPKSDLEKISRATSGKIISNIDEISSGSFGKAESVYESKSGDEKLIFIKGCKNPRAVSIVLRGSTEHVLDEIERAIKDGLGDVVSSLKSGKIVAGGGAVEMELSKRLRSYSKTIRGREQLAIEEFANALESIPETLAENAGLDPIEIITELRRRHDSGMVNQGLNLFVDKIQDTFEAGIIEPLKVKTQAISSASEVAQMILRIDDVLISKDTLDSQERKRMDSYRGMD